MTTSYVKIANPAGSISSRSGFAAAANTTGAFVVTVPETPGANSGVTVISVDAAGAALWKTNISWATNPINTTGEHMVATNAAGDVVVAAHHTTYSQVFRLNSSGTVVWSRKVSPRVQALNILSDGSAIIGAASVPGAAMNDILAIKLAAADGTTSWVRQLVDDGIVGTTPAAPPATADGSLFHAAPIELPSGDLVFAHAGPLAGGFPGKCITKLTSTGTISWTRDITWENAGYFDHYRVQLGTSTAGDLWVAHSFTDFFAASPIPSVSFIKLNTSTGAVLAAHKLRGDGVMSGSASGDHSGFSGNSTLNVMSDGRIVAAGRVGDEISGYPGLWTKPSASPTGASATAMPYFTPASTPSTYFKQVTPNNTSARFVGGYLDGSIATTVLIAVSSTAIDGTADNGAAGFSQTRATGSATYATDASASTSVTLAISTGTGGLSNTASTTTVTASGLTVTVPTAGPVASGFSTTAFGTPARTDVFPAVSATFPQSFGTPTRTLNRTLAATGETTTAFGYPEAGMVMDLSVAHRPLSIDPTAAFGTPSAAFSYTAVASGSVTTAIGTPASGAQLAATGIASTALGTPAGNAPMGATGVRSTALGTPTFGLVLKPAAIASTSFGTAVASWRYLATPTPITSTAFGGAQAHLHFNPRSAVFRTSFGAPRAS